MTLKKAQINRKLISQVAPFFAQKEWIRIPNAQANSYSRTFCSAGPEELFIS